LEFDISKVSPISVIGGAKSESGSTCLSIEPRRGVIKAGEKVSITVKFEISRREAQLLFLYQTISERLCVSTNEESQESHYLNIKCEYLRSCFGAPLAILNACPGFGNKSIRQELHGLTYDDLFKLMSAHEA
jgi:hypothetical protein